MNSTGVVVEYNPFHNGHAYHLNEARKMTNADVLIAVMSGNFLQRGEPAIVSKWARTKMALESGVDIVVELPYSFAVQQAKYFAFGAISILDHLKCNHFCFGSESGNINDFLRTMEVIEENRDQYEDQVKQLIKSGISYPKALTNSFSALDLGDKVVDLTKPNNILGYHYVLAAHQIQSNMKGYTVERKNANYHDENFTSATIASATAIRKAIIEKKSLDMIKQFVPESTLHELRTYHQKFGNLHNWELYWPFLQFKLLTMDIDELACIYEVEEGIEFRLKRAARKSSSFEIFMKELKTKRYTWTRLQRICTHVLTNTKKTTMVRHHKQVEYIRLLGMSSKGQNYLNEIKKDIQIPIVSKQSAIDESLTELDTRASDVYAQVLSEPFREHLSKMEYAQPPIIKN